MSYLYPGVTLQLGIALTAAVCMSPPASVQAIGHRAEPPRQIKTWSNFEHSFLAKELHFTRTKILPGYRIYSDSNNNFLIALQVDGSGNILTERILPLQQKPSDAQSKGLMLFVIDFIYGDGSALNDAKAGAQMQPHLLDIAAPKGAQIGDFHVCSTTDVGKVRSGFDVQTKAALPWNPPPPVGQKPEAPDSSQVISQLQSELKSVQADKQNLTAKLNDSTRELEHKQAALSVEKTSCSQLEGKLDQVQAERDTAVSKMKYMEEAEQGRIARFAREMAALHPTLQASQAVSISMAERPAPASDAYVAGLSGFNPRSYRQDVERRINSGLQQATPGLTPRDALVPAQADVTFNIMPDGTPVNLSVSVVEPKVDEELREKIRRAAQSIVLSSAPFRPLSLYPVKAIRMSVSLNQTVQGDTVGCSTSAQFADRPKLLSRSCNSERQE